MELIVKLYSDKPSKIGVKYGQEYLAVRAYEEILRKDTGDIFTLKMEMVKDKLNLVLISEQTGERILYKDLGYKMEQLKKLQVLIQPGNDLQFVHVFSKANTLVIAKAFRGLRFIRLSNYEIISTGNFTNTL